MRSPHLSARFTNVAQMVQPQGHFRKASPNRYYKPIRSATQFPRGPTAQRASHNNDRLASPDLQAGGIEDSGITRDAICWASRSKRKQMIDPCEPNVSVMRQCQLLNISRSCFYYKPKPIAAEDLELMRLIDEQYLKTPSWGSRSMRNHLRRLGFKINRKKVQRLMRLMGLEAIYPKPKTSRPHPQHKVYPYLLRNLQIDRPNQVWAADITYIPMNRGFMYLVAVMDWHSRKILSWRLSNTLDTDFCVEALQEAISRFGSPEIFNTDQGAQFTASAFADVLNSYNVRISMDGRGRVQDNIFIERLWWTLKYQYLYLWSFDNGAELRKELEHWFNFYNGERSHQALDNLTPDEVYFALPHPLAQAA